MKEFNSQNIIYIEQDDIKRLTDGRYKLYSDIINPRTKKRFFSGECILLVQGNFCGYCNDFKPHFQEVADIMASKSPIEFCTIQIDSKYRKEQIFQDSDVVNSLVGKQIPGVPAIFRFKKGLSVQEFKGERTKEGLIKWL
jgi:thiol-disulfide isomerase/thioredoxin